MTVIRERGFTLIELMVTLAIVGILLSTAVPIYHMYQQRAYGAEATVMTKQIINAEIAYFLENNNYYPANKTFVIDHSGYESPGNAQEEVYKNLHVQINKGHFIDYTLSGEKDDNGNPSFFLSVQTAEGFNFNLFKGTKYLWVTIDKDGNINTYNNQPPSS